MELIHLHKHQFGCQFGDNSKVWIGNRTLQVKLAQIESYSSPVIQPSVDTATLCKNYKSRPLQVSEISCHVPQGILRDDQMLLRGTIHPPASLAKDILLKGPQVPKLPIKLSDYGGSNTSTANLFFMNEPLKREVEKFMKNVEDGKTTLNLPQARLVRLVLHRFQKRYVKKLPYVGGLNEKIVDRFSLKGTIINEKARTCQAPYNLGMASEKLIEESIQKDIEAGFRFVLKKGQVINTSPCFIIYEKDKYRIVGACQKINANQRLDPFPGPIVEESLEKLAQARYKSSSDAKSAYHQCLVDFYTAVRCAWVTRKNIKASVRCSSV